MASRWVGHPLLLQILNLVPSVHLMLAGVVVFRGRQLLLLRLCRSWMLVKLWLAISAAPCWRTLVQMSSRYGAYTHREHTWLA